MLNLCIWEPQQQPVAIVQIVHGMIEFIERYDAFARYLTERGILVVGHDHLGHGQSVNDASEYGMLEQGSGMQEIIADVYQISQRFKGEYPKIPYIIFGHSMGSFILRAYLMRYSAEISGAILCGTGEQSPILTSFGWVFASIIEAFKGKHYRSVLLETLSSGKFNKKFETNEHQTGAEWLTRDEAEVEKYIHDYRTQFIFTVSAYKELFKLLIKVNSQSAFQAVRQDLAIFVVAGEDDPLGDFGKGVRLVGEKFEKTGHHNIELKLYPEYRHEILNEIGKEIVYADIFSWIQKECL